MCPGKPHLFAMMPIIYELYNNYADSYEGQSVFLLICSFLSTFSLHRARTSGE